MQCGQIRSPRLLSVCLAELLKLYSRSINPHLCNWGRWHEQCLLNLFTLALHKSSAWSPQTADGDGASCSLSNLRNKHQPVKAPLKWLPKTAVCEIGEAQIKNLPFVFASPSLTEGSVRVSGCSRAGSFNSRWLAVCGTLMNTAPMSGPGVGHGLC